MTFISYAQNFEDVILHRALKNVKSGFYIDVGANDPVIDSVTKSFYDSGWRGINIEPVKEWFEKLQQERPGDINLQLAAGNHKGDVDFYEVIGTGLSTMDKLIAERHVQERGYKIKKYKVPVTKLSTICEQHPNPDIHFLKIDVEGAEKSVLQGLDLKKIRPWICVVESTLPNLPTEDYENWEQILLAADYEFVYFDGLNRFYVANEHKKLKKALAIPPNVFDNFVLSGKSNSSLHYQIAQVQTSQVATNRQQQVLEAARQETEQQRKLETQVTALLTNATQQDELLRDKETKLQELLLSLTEKETQLQEVATALTGNKRQIDKLETQIRTAQALTTQQDQLLRDKEINLQELLLSLTEKEIQLQETTAALTDNKKRVNELHQTSLHWKFEAERQKVELGAVYKSKSWRFTLPLRKLWKPFDSKPKLIATKTAKGTITDDLHNKTVLLLRESVEGEKLSTDEILKRIRTELANTKKNTE